MEHRSVRNGIGCARAAVIALAALGAACGSMDTNGEGDLNAHGGAPADAAGGGSTGGGANAGGGGGSGSTGGGNAGGGGSTGGGGSPSSDAGGGGATDGGGAGGGGSGGGAGSPGPQGALPAPTGTCPAIAQGSVTFAPAGIPPRAVQIWMSDAAAAKHGPLIFYWHGTGSSPQEASYALGATLNAIVAAGGIVAAPTHDTNAGQFPWYLVSSDKDDDLKVADEVLACAQQKIGVDARRIHSMGMSAGGLMTTQMSFRRSAYLASVVTFSGGLPPQAPPPAYEDPSNKYAAMIFYGGTADDVFNFDFAAASQKLKDTLVHDGHFAFLCNHGRGHAIPTDAAASVWDFFQAHPFGTNPSPYAGGLPKSFPTYCTL